jgi:hypothetical protein
VSAQVRQPAGPVRVSTPDGHQLQGEPEHHVRATVPADQHLVVVEEEQLRQHQPGQPLTVTAIPGFLIGQELNRHAQNIGAVNRRVTRPKRAG